MGSKQQAKRLPNRENERKGEDILSGGKSKAKAHRHLPGFFGSHFNTFIFLKENMVNSVLVNFSLSKVNMLSMLDFFPSIPPKKKILREKAGNLIKGSGDINCGNNHCQTMYIGGK